MVTGASFVIIVNILMSDIQKCKLNIRYCIHLLYYYYFCLAYKTLAVKFIKILEKVLEECLFIYFLKVVIAVPDVSSPILKRQML